MVRCIRIVSGIAQNNKLCMLEEDEVPIRVSEHACFAASGHIGVDRTISLQSRKSVAPELCVMLGRLGSSDDNRISGR